MEAFVRDLRFAARMLLSRPGFTVLAVVCLALGIGASAAIFSVVNGVLLKPLPFPESERLFAFGSSRGKIERGPRLRSGFRRPALAVEARRSGRVRRAVVHACATTSLQSSCSGRESHRISFECSV